MTEPNLYTERARLLGLLALCFPSSLEQSDPSPGFAWVLIMTDFGGNQIGSWHIADHDLRFFPNVRRNAGLRWDGHTTEEKHARIERRIENGQPCPLEWVKPQELWAALAEEPQPRMAKTEKLPENSEKTPEKPHSADR